MPDREKVIKGLEYCAFGSSDPCYEKECPYYQSDCTEELKDDILALLKELEPIAPSVCGSKEPDGHGSWRYLCGKCKKPIDYKDRACKRCGRLVKWE